MKFEYCPEVVDPQFFTPQWFGDRCSDLLESRWLEAWPDAFGFDRQYDRTIGEDGKPGEYIQVWMSYEESE